MRGWQVGRLTKKAPAYSANIAITLVAVYVIVVVTGCVTDQYTCITEQKISIPNFSGMEFEVTYTNCDRILKDEAIDVYVSRAIADGESLFTRWRSPRTLLFRYDPGRYDSPLPSIKATGPDRILISVPYLASVFLQIRKWGNVSVDYDIGHIEFP
jgi:hypothetical protein